MLEKPDHPYQFTLPDPGTYALLLRVEIGKSIRIGALGELRSKPGAYLYVGSAFGPGGLRGRLKHHLQPVTRPHWHIDYLRSVSQVTEVWYTLDPIRREHLWAEAAKNLSSDDVPLIGFGSSDCSCITHLLYYSTLPLFDHFCQSVLNLAPDHEPVFRFVSLFVS